MVISEMGVGGAEKVVVECLRDAAAHGDELALLAGLGKLDAELEGLQLRRQGLPTSRSASSLFKSINIATRFTRRFKPDLIHSHNVRVTAVARVSAGLAAPFSRPPLLVTYHGVPLEEEERATKLLRFADFVVCVSEDLKRSLEERGFPADRIDVIPNGVPDPPLLTDGRRSELNSDLALPEDTKVISIVGRLVPQKAHERFLRAAAIVAKAQSHTRFLIVGDGERRQELEELAADLKIGEAVLFTGIRSDAADIISRSDLLVFSSNWEGLSIAALEALARGVPVVSTDVAGARELLTSGAGVIVPQDHSALAEAIVSALADQQGRERMGAEGRRLHAERFSVTHMTAGYRRLYATLTGR